MKKPVVRLLIIGILVLALMVTSLRPAAALSPSVSTGIASWTGAAIGIAAFSYLAWINRPANQPVDWSVQGPGGFYFGFYSGVSFVPTMDWRYGPNPQAPLPYNVTAQNVGLSSSMVGGMKGGYFFHSFPYLGLEGEFNFTRNYAPEQTVKISPPLPPNNRIPGTQALFPRQGINIMTLAMHLVARYGFIKDEEVPFGRLQPYVGIGPGFTVIYGQADSAKNFGIDGMLGLRFMLRRNLSLFTEFKFNHQFKVELENQKLKQLPSYGGFEQRGTATFDFTVYQAVFGMSFHFR
jgi:outer membrane protein W